MINAAPFILTIYFEQAVILTILVSFILLFWYRYAVNRNMRAAISTPEATDVSTLSGTTAALPKIIEGVTPATLSQGEMTVLNYWEHGLRTRLIITYGAAGAAAAAVLAALFLISLGDEVNGLQAFVVWYVYAWPIVFTLAALLVLSQRRALLVFGGYVLTGWAVVLVWSVLSRIALDRAYVSPLQNIYSYMHFLSIQTLAFLIVIITINKRLRSVSPFVLAGLLVFSFSNSLVTDLLERSFDYVAVRRKITMLGAEFWVIFWFMLAALPIGYACWRALCWLSRSFERKAFSDIQLLVDSWWLIAVFYQTQDLAIEFGWAAFAGGLLAFVAYRVVVGFGLTLWRIDRYLRGNSRLLLLRVFGFQRRTEKLFDAIAQRWRMFGSVKLIGAADLAMRTIEPSDIISFVGGRIRRLFVRNRADLVQQLERIDDMRDPDGRFRINKFFCHDDTWRSTLQALLAHSDIVLMDLRGFSRSNSGCLFELQQLVVNGLLPRTVFVVDDTTDTALLEATLGRQMQEAGIGDRAAPLRLNIESMQSRSQTDLDRIRNRLAVLAVT
jgi:hypothetical protein